MRGIDKYQRTAGQTGGIVSTKRRMIILLAKRKIMYYPNDQTLIAASKRFAAFLIFSAILITFNIPGVSATEFITSQAEDYRNLGYEAQQKGNYEKALTYYTKAISLGIENEIVYNDTGILYEQIGVPQKAEESYLAAIRINRDYLPPYTNLAMLYEAQSDAVRAIAYFNERLKRSPPHDPWKAKIARELSRINPSAKLKTIDQQLGEVSFQLAEEAKQKKLKELSIQLLRADQYYQKSEEYLNAKKFEEALAQVDGALTITPNNPKFIKARERVLYMQQVEKIKERTKSALDNLESGDPDAAKVEFQKVLTTIPKEPSQ